MTMFEKIVNAIKMIFEVLINLHHIFAPKKDEDNKDNAQDTQSN